ncbi:hypothetical protein C8K38_10642 [Rhodococcus sp. OK611]|jgi:hypothetical protein|uniref:hypothetical protein n=1 Tax=unclassified Rhodococcus (in: high G+C Gram-positive bacteria) TaxID=192944 RepID=UPI000BC9DB37|nr:MULTISPECIES: hypothetical protein [unclassified Rhodococcus (in: high G+C Gram-positive bacteria)]PTR43691.1 hypothetical protein C8K38_10642 [Rhodococcus sp. OK611]SNX90509.1 hypothetical protein SAMN05447004_10642 [Rhodococcus sp. OK270]
MTSPDRAVPSGAYTGGSIRNLQKVTWDSARSQILSSVTASFAGVGAIGSNLNSATKLALNAATDAQSGATQAQASAVAVQKTTTDNAASLEGLVATQYGQATGGTAFSDAFNRSQLGPDYTTFKTGPVADLVVIDGQVQLNRSGDKNTGDVVALSKTVTGTDDQRVSVVVGRIQEHHSAAARIIVRSATDLSTFVYAHVYRDSVHLGWGTRSGNTTVYNFWKSGDTAVGTGDTVTVEAVGRTYKVLVNGVLVAGHTDGDTADPPKSPIGANNRSFGFGCQYRWTGLFGYFSFAINALTAADLSSPPIVGTGWSLYRLNPEKATQPAGEARLAANTFDTLGPARNIAVPDLGRGQVQIEKSGWYAITTAYALFSYTERARVGLWTAPAPGGTWSLARVGASTSENERSYSFGSSFTVFLQQGSVVAPGYYLSGDNGFVGTATYFDGAMLSY